MKRSGSLTKCKKKRKSRSRTELIRSIIKAACNKYQVPYNPNLLKCNSNAVSVWKRPLWYSDYKFKVTRSIKKSMCTIKRSIVNKPADTDLDQSKLLIGDRISARGCSEVDFAVECSDAFLEGRIFEMANSTDSPTNSGKSVPEIKITFEQMLSIRKKRLHSKKRISQSNQDVDVKIGDELEAVSNDVKIGDELEAVSNDVEIVDLLDQNQSVIEIEDDSTVALCDLSCNVKEDEDTNKQVGETSPGAEGREFKHCVGEIIDLEDEEVGEQTPVAEVTETKHSTDEVIDLVKSVDEITLETDVVEINGCENNNVPKLITESSAPTEEFVEVAFRVPDANEISNTKINWQLPDYIPLELEPTEITNTQITSTVDISNKSLIVNTPTENDVPKLKNKRTRWSFWKKPTRSSFRVPDANKISKTKVNGQLPDYIPLVLQPTEIKNTQITSIVDISKESLTVNAPTENDVPKLENIKKKRTRWGSPSSIITLPDSVASSGPDVDNDVIFVSEGFVSPPRPKRRCSNQSSAVTITNDRKQSSANGRITKSKVKRAKKKRKPKAAKNTVARAPALTLKPYNVRVSIAENKDRRGLNDTFGTNIYNTGSLARVGLREVIIDGSNVALGNEPLTDAHPTEFLCIYNVLTRGGLEKLYCKNEILRGGHLPANWRPRDISQLAVNVLNFRGLKIAIDYFLKKGHKVRAFIPQYRLKFTESTDPHLLKRLVAERLVIVTPSREVNGRRITPYDDRYIIQFATTCEGIVVSNDNYRDLQIEKPEWRETIEKRLLMYTWVDDVLIFPEDPLGRHGPTLTQFLKFP